MPHRMDVEITSDRGDGTWSWRAAGARQPKGVVDGSLLPEGAGAGDVLRVEAEMGIDGIAISAVLPSRERKRREPERLEVVGTPEPRPAAAPTQRPSRTRRDRDGAQDSDGTRRDGAARPERARGRHRDGDRTAQPDRPRGRERPERPRRDRDRDREGGVAAKSSSRDRRLSVGHRHRSEVLAELPPEQRPVAEKVLRGGLPAVRQAIEAQNAELRSQGRPEIKADALVAIAEQLLPRLRSAEWHDRAEAVAKDLDTVPMRDLRPVVAGADAAARDNETRELAGTLRQALERRQQEQRQRWTGEITTALDEGKVVRALRLSARPPDPGTRFPADLALRLGEAAGQAMAPDTPPERWAAVLEAVAESPVRRSVKPAGMPQGAGEDLLNAARRASGRVPALAPLLGIDMPPPPGPPRPARPRPGPRRAPTGKRPLPASSSETG